MEFQIKKENILRGLSKIQGITGKKTNIPITSNVLFSAKEDHLSVLATDLEIAFQGAYEADVVTEGSCALPSRKLYEIVRELPSDTVTLKEMENKWVKIVNGQIEYKIMGMESEEFPGVPNVEGVDLWEMDAGVLHDMIDKTVYAVLSDEGRAHLAGVYFESIDAGDGKTLRMVSTDGHRLSRVDYSVDSDQKLVLKEGVIIPKSGIIEVQRLLEGGERVGIGFKESNFIVKKGSEGLIVRLIEGEFPDYQLVIPKKNKGEMKVDRGVFLMMLKRMSILSSDKFRSVRFNIGKKEMETVTTNPDIGESREVIPVEYTGEEMEIAFNPRYFIEAVSRMKSEEVVVRLSDEASPCLIEGEKDPDFLSVIMPMRI